MVVGAAKPAPSFRSSVSTFAYVIGCVFISCRVIAVRVPAATSLANVASLFRASFARVSRRGEEKAEESRSQAPTMLATQSRAIRRELAAASMPVPTKWAVLLEVSE
jgi:hypothetical protein